MRNPFTKFALVISALTVLLMFTAATPPDRYPVHVTSSYLLTGAMSNIFSANTTAASNAWSQTFAPSNSLYQLSLKLNTESNRVNSLEAVTNALGAAAFTASSAYATAAQGAKADTAQPGNSTLTNLASLTLSGNAGKVPTVNAGGTAFELQTPSGGGGSSYITPMVHTLTTISNSTVETDVLSFVITNNTFTTGKKIRIKLLADWLKNTGGSETTTNIIKLGATRAYQDSIGAPANNALSRAPEYEIYILAVSNTEQHIRGSVWYYNVGSADIGEGDGSQTTPHRFFPMIATTSEDMTSGNKTFSLSVNFSGASSALYFRPRIATVEMLSQ